MEERPEYRIFISHSSEDKDKVELIKNALESNGLKPFYSASFEGGDNFFEMIEKYIAHSHIFLPLISESSSSRGWVHQEIGIANALHIPIVPVSIDRLPEQMMCHLHAISWNDGKELKDKLNYERFNRKINEFKYEHRPLLECGLKDEDRTNMMVEYARNVVSFGEHGIVRQMARMSSFHIPNTYPDDPKLKEHFGFHKDEGSSYKSLIEERRILEEHAKVRGCKLIINPCETVRRYPNNIAKLRINELIKFLDDMDDNKVEIAIKGDEICGKEDYIEGAEIKNIDKNLTIVGDWFFAESILSPKGYGHPWTIFTRHAPTVLDSIKDFDVELDALLNNQNRKGLSSRKYVINQLYQILDNLS
jgi:hypothetical protein